MLLGFKKVSRVDEDEVLPQVRQGLEVPVADGLLLAVLSICILTPPTVMESEEDNPPPPPPWLGHQGITFPLGSRSEILFLTAVGVLTKGAVPPLLLLRKGWPFPPMKVVVWW